MNGAHPILTGADWVLRTVSGPGGRDAVYGAQCTTCRETSGHGSEAARSVGAWAVEHTRAHPEHRGYASITRTHWRVDPDTTPPAATPALAATAAPAGPVEPDTEKPPTPHTPRPAHPRHAHPLPAQMWMQAWVLPIAGPLFLASISAALGFFFGALFAAATG